MIEYEFNAWNVTYYTVDLSADKLVVQFWWDMTWNSTFWGLEISTLDPGAANSLSGLEVVDTEIKDWNSDNDLTRGWAGNTFFVRFDWAYLPIESGDIFTARLDYAQKDDIQPVPEPATMHLMGTGLIGLAALAGRRARRRPQTIACYLSRY